MGKIVSLSLASAVFVSCASMGALAADRTAAFKKADRNGNGSLTRGEFKRFIDILAKQNDRLGKRVVSFGSAGYDQAWTTANGNRDNKITPQELSRF